MHSRSHYGPFFIAFSSLTASPKYRDLFLEDTPGLLAPKQARCFRGSLLRNTLRAACVALYSRSVVVFWYAIWSASLPAEAFILAHWPALSGIHFGGFRERLVTPNNWFRGWRDGSARNWKVFGAATETMAYCLWFVSEGCGLRIRRPENMTYVFLGKNKSSRDRPR